MLGRFKGARAFRSPCAAGVPWGRVLYRETRDSRSGEVLEALYPRKHGVSVEAANQLLESVTDLEVEIHFDCGACEPAPRSVKWADLEETDGEDERRAEAAVGGKGVSEHASESSGPHARMGTAAGSKGVSWHAPESGGSRAPLKDPMN